MREHFHSVTKADQNFIIIGSHLNSELHNGLDDIEITVLESITLPPNGERSKLLQDHLKLNGIHRLHSVLSLGFYTMD